MEGMQQVIAAAAQVTAFTAEMAQHRAEMATMMGKWTEYEADKKAVHTHLDTQTNQYK